MSKLLNVHEILSESAQDYVQETEAQMVTTSFKVQSGVKNAAQELCEENGSTVSAFLRKCLEALVRDYQPGQH